MTILVFILGSAAQTKSKQFHRLQRTSLILTARQNAPYPGKGAGKGTTQCSHHLLHGCLARPVTNHTQLPGLVFQALPPTEKKKIYRTPRQKKNEGNPKVKPHLQTS